MFLVRIFLRNCPLTYFLGQMDYLVHFEEKLFGWKLQSFLPKTPLKSFFRMVRFEAIFITKLPPHLFFDAKQTMWFVSRVNCPGWKLQLFLPKTPPKSFFRKTTFPVQFFFFLKPPPHLIFWPNELLGAFGGKIVSNVNFARFCLKCAQNHFSKKHVFSPNYSTKQPPHLFSGLNGLCRAFRGKIVLNGNFARGVLCKSEWNFLPWRFFLEMRHIVRLAPKIGKAVS